MLKRLELSDGSARILLWIGSASAVASVGLSPLNDDVSSLLAIHQLPGDFKKIIQITEGFGHGIGVLTILSAIALISPNRKAYVPVIALLAFGGGAFAEIANIAIRTFSYLPEWRSFPSGHAATAVGLAVGLTLMLPRGRWFFVGLAVFTLIQQIADHAHFLSDVLAGASIGLVWSIGLLRHPIYAWLFELIKAYLNAPQDGPRGIRGMGRMQKTTVMSQTIPSRID